MHTTSKIWWYYKAWWFKINDSFSIKHTVKGGPKVEPFELLVWPPIFLDFLDFNPDNYESFRAFTERFGLDWFCEFDDEESPYNLKVELDKKKVHPLSQTYMKNCLERMANKIKKEQQLLREVWDAFEEYKPLSPYNYPDSNPRLEAVLDINWEKRKTLELRPAVVHQGNKTKILEMPSHESKSLIAICHFEAWVAFDNKWWTKKCELCHNRFFSSKKNEHYCDRLAPPKFWKNLEPKGINDFQKLKCKKLGPQITFNKTLQKNEKMRTYREEYKRRVAKLSYLKRKGRPYEAELREFEKWKSKEKEEVKNGNDHQKRKA